MAKKGIPFYKSVLFKIPMIFILVVLLSLQIIGAYFIKQLESEMLASFDEQVSVQMSFLEESARPILDDDNLDNQEKADRLNTIFHRFNSNNILESQILDRNGFLVASSSPNSQAHLGQRVTREDIDQTLYNNTASSREIYDAEQNILVKQYVAPILSSDSSGQLVGVLNLRVNIESVYRQIQNIIIIYLSSSAVSLLFTIVLAFLISTGITRPLKAMKDQAEKIADGDFNGQVQVYSDDEIGNLAESINYLSVRVKEAQESTESERQRLDSVLKHMTDGVMATDRRGRIILTNRKALDFISSSEEEVMGHSIMEVLHLQDRYSFRELFDSNDEILMDMSTPDQESVIKGEYSIIQRDSGFISGLVWVLTDVTEREKIERDRRQFVSNVSHELRTPLTSVRSYSEALADGALADQELAVEFLGVIQNETDRMIRMIGDLLHLSNMDSGKEQLNFELVSFTALVSHVLDRFDMMVQSGQFGSDRPFTIVRELAGEEYFVEIDQDRMTQVIDNIINNAIKYSPDGGTITVRLMSTHNEVTLSVQDQGLGVPQKSIPHLFDRFYRVDKARSRAQGGTGLGLAIAKEVIEMHHGRIWVNSIENKGSTFFVSLPYVEIYGEDEWDA
ncbi:cell wall metabolism sensor histidine kinase WalK [Aerococcus sp. UMB8608]|uniref:histidine kinase n=1 Tax=Aerococcus sanguinicola TaxID=119206 RepID=A0A5N1GK47_9LACT|nr:MULTISPECIES: cell wall metabolism sensor histidine kinase WalK [Aerococcus]KAA9300391.1 cell wall metabolism sensor histidine kinase WalK [Aerococcus sanguinicola]MDK6678882.1 cell wall metabolism sensor histidine kinase WalK [Aerococcus sp. UMB8608]MDK6686800.1 cell wall metabolism sensor histidine kinase WalK [Aerococcus sp. UMB8623]MDK6939540.1 cell wall metabolism sensor histidine kinase WalK [Aerococcus sp. UMB8487]OFK18073.1 PAS domain-containing sensor histidine kinase [Aerococcus s